MTRMRSGTSSSAARPQSDFMPSIMVLRRVDEDDGREMMKVPNNTSVIDDMRSSPHLQRCEPLLCTIREGYMPIDEKSKCSIHKMFIDSIFVVLL